MLAPQTKASPVTHPFSKLNGRAFDTTYVMQKAPIILTNATAQYENLQITVAKSFITLTPKVLNLKPVGLLLWHRHPLEFKAKGKSSSVYASPRNTDEWVILLQNGPIRLAQAWRYSQNFLQSILRQKLT